jgi:hypothetical protein
VGEENGTVETGKKEQRIIAAGNPSFLFDRFVLIFIYESCCFGLCSVDLEKRNSFFLE